jgi:ribosomal protein L7/L12
MQATDSGNTLPPDAVAALHQGDKIGAIKCTREHFGLGLKEAKDRVDAYVASQPQLASTLQEAQAGSRRGNRRAQRMSIT